MDSILTIGLGLGIRVLVNITSHSNVGLAGSIVGFWEGLVLYHYINKWPTVYDPYIAYALRILLDIATTDTFFRLVLILLWTGLGLLLSDVAPILWERSGLGLVWKNLCEDMSTLQARFSHSSSSRSKSHHVSSTSSSHISHISRASTPSHIRFHHFPSAASTSSLQSPPSTSIRSSSSAHTKTPTSSSLRSSSPAGYKSSSSTMSSMTATTQTTQTILPIPPPRDPRRRLTTKVFPGAFQDDISEASTIPPSSPPPSPPRGTFVPLSMRSHSQVASSASSSAISLRAAARAARSERSERTSDWLTDVSASVAPVYGLAAIPETSQAPPPPAVTPPPPAPSVPTVPPPRSVSLARGQTTPGTRELFLSRRSSVVDAVETRPPLEEVASVRDGATDAWETIDDDGRATTAQETDRPPSYQDEYSHPAEEVGEPVEEKSEPPVPKVDTKGRLRSAMKLRSEIAALQKRLKAVEKERAQAKANNKSALALQKKMEREQLKAEIEKLKKKHDKRMVSLYNDGEITDRINLADLDDETAVEELEKAIETLISSSFEPSDAAGPSTSADSLLGATTLYVEVDSASKQGAIMQAMIEHGIPVKSDGITNILIVTLPRA